MLNSNDRIVKHKLGPLNLAEEPGGGFFKTRTVHHSLKLNPRITGIFIGNIKHIAY